jgi:beta-lactamase superfamily II metal-dependent hydrolase
VITVEALAAEDGDCLWIEWTAPDGPHRMLVDGGRTGAGLTRRLAAQPVDQRHFDVVMCTHIDLDHIGGLLPLFRRPPEGFGVGDVWFNSRHHLVDTRVDDTLGVDHGEELTDLLEGSRAWNEAFAGRAVVAPAVVDTLPGLTVTVLAPDPGGLKRLLEHWPEVVEEGRSGEEADDLPRDALGGDDDFPLDSLDELLGARYRRDPSPANGSSIAVLLTDDEGTRVLLGADAPAEPLVAALQQLATAAGRVTVDLCKLPHHGSAGNVSPALLGALDCRQWLVSTNGGPRGRHPSPVAVARILDRGDRPTLWFNYCTPVTERFGSEPVQLTWDAKAVYPLPKANGIALQVGPSGRVQRVPPQP